MSSYNHLRQRVKVAGSSWSPDGKPVKELLVCDSTFAVGEVVGRQKMNPKLGFMEGLQLVAGTDSREAVLAVAPKVDIGMFTGMSFYGPRVKDQVPTVIKELVRDPQSRRAVLTVAGDPVRDIPINEEPCTIAIQFLIRGMLHVVAYMRSSDVVWGVPYDVMQFGVLGLAVAACLGVKPGFVYMVGGSVHEYESTKDTNARGESRYFMLSPGYHLRLGPYNPLDRWGSLVEWARTGTFYPDQWVEEGIPNGMDWTDTAPYLQGMGPVDSG